MTKKSEIQVLDEREWILKRPSIYLGSAKPVEVDNLYFIKEARFKSVIFVPALQKLFDECVENAVDEYTRTKKEDFRIEVTFNENKSITVSDNGRGLEIEKHHQFPDLYVPEVIFTKLRSGSNFGDIREGVGVNGLGISLTVLFSDHFQVVTYNNKKKYKQEFLNMLKEESEPVIKSISSDRTGTEITFLPNFKFFEQDDWNYELITKKVYDLAYFYPDIKFVLNGEKIKVKDFKHYIDNYTENYVYAGTDEAEILVTDNPNDTGFRFHVIVNGANVYNGGSVIDYTINNVMGRLRPKLEKKFKVDLKPADFKDNINVFLQMKLTNPLFTSQTKDTLSNTYGEIGEVLLPILSNEGFLNKLYKQDGIVNAIVKRATERNELAKLKELKKGNRKGKRAFTFVNKLHDATSAERDKCVLFLTEGDGARGAIDGNRNPKFHATLPLKGKPLNITGEKLSTVVANKELQEIILSIFKINEKEISDLYLGKIQPELRYGKIVIATDTDPDGFAIRALLINFFWTYFPWLIKNGNLKILTTALLIAKKGKEKKYFFSKEEFEQIKDKYKDWAVKYYKGLGSYDDAGDEDMEHFLKEDENWITVVADEYTNNILKMAFDGDSGPRKTWLMGGENA